MSPNAHDEGGWPAGSGDWPEVVSREEWLVRRMALLAKDEELTRARDALNASRRQPPWCAWTSRTPSRARMVTSF